MVLAGLLTHVYVCVCVYVCVMRSGLEHAGNNRFLLRLLSMRHQIHPRFVAAQRDKSARKIRNRGGRERLDLRLVFQSAGVTRVATNPRWSCHYS